MNCIWIVFLLHNLETCFISECITHNIFLNLKYYIIYKYVFIFLIQNINFEFYNSEFIIDFQIIYVSYLDMYPTFK